MDQTINSTADYSQDALVSGQFFHFMLIAAALLFASWWRMFEKVGLPGWKALIPFYNTWIVAQIAGREGWMGLAMSLSAMIPDFGPIISMVFQIIIYTDISKAFGKSTGFTFGLVLLPFIFFPILAFGNSQYQYFTDEQEYEEPDNS